jgi:4,5-DOPA dioxygenase extradiol
MARIPVLFLSHGSPMHGLEPGSAAAAWRAVAARLPRPGAILVVSAHWETERPMLTANPQPETIHDFYGFPPALYELRYPAPGAPDLARRTSNLLRAAGFDAGLDAERGLDHGAWVPLRFAYPKADIPVTQLSVQPRLGPRHHYAMGGHLAALADDDVLILCTGHVTHNLRDWTPSDDGSRPAAYAVAFQSWLHHRLTARDDEAVIDYRSRAPHAARAHPSEEHFLPLHVALGAAAKSAKAERVHAGMIGTALAMDAYLFA